MDERVDKRQASGRKREALSDLAKSLPEGPRRSATPMASGVLLAHCWHGQTDERVVYGWRCLYVWGENLCMFS